MFFLGLIVGILIGVGTIAGALQYEDLHENAEPHYTPVEDLRVRNPIDGGLDEITGVTNGVIETRTARDNHS